MVFFIGLFCCLHFLCQALKSDPLGRFGVHDTQTGEPPFKGLIAWALGSRQNFYGSLSEEEVVSDDLCGRD